MKRGSRKGPGSGAGGSEPARAGDPEGARTGQAGLRGSVGIRRLTEADAPEIARIFNYYVRKSFAAFPDREAGMPFILQVFEQARNYGTYAVELDGTVIGFGMVRPLYPFPNLGAVGEVSYFICPEFTGRGLGGRLVGILEGRARELGMTSLVARVSSRNRRSIRFHRKNGFSLCGRIRGVGEKFGKPFDVVILQKPI